MNLLKNKWITVVRRNGDKEEIAPYEITDQIDSNPIIEIIAPRPDFKGALYQFLIGLYQTVYAPKNEIVWEDRFNAPPSTKDLMNEMDKVTFAFDLFGEQIRFMQDMSLTEKDSKTNISSLFIDSPGENTLKENKDHFIKRNTIDKVCPKCAALGLFALQTNSPAGGQGHLTSIRGGGPLTTLLKYDTKEEEDLKYKTLWSDIWLNVLPENNFKGDIGFGDKYKYVLPWTITKFIEKDKDNDLKREEKKKGKTVELSGIIATTQDLHGYSIYWSYPRRILLNSNERTELCDICGEKSETIIDSYLAKTYGFDYGGGGWIHPLSPYYFKKDKDLGETWFPYHPQPGGIIYNTWQAFIYGVNGKDKNAKVISYFLESGRKEGQTIVYAFGYDMDNMKARCWYESLIPIYHIEPKYNEKYESVISSILQSASQVANNLQTKVKDAWFNDRVKPRGDFDYLKIEFFKATDAKFYELAKLIRDQLDRSDPFDDQAKMDWLKYLNTESLKIFDLYVESGSIEFENIQRIVNARSSLISWNLGDKMKKNIGLPTQEKPIAKKKSTNKKGEKTK